MKYKLFLNYNIYASIFKTVHLACSRTGKGHCSFRKWHAFAKLLRSLPPIRRGSCSTYSWWWVGSCGEIPWVGRCLGPDSQYLFTFECDALVDLSVTVECRPRLDDGGQCHTQGTAVKTHTMTAWSANLKKSFKYTYIK